jgi:hypothetical protein
MASRLVVDEGGDQRKEMRHPTSTWRNDVDVATQILNHKEKDA